MKRIALYGLGIETKKALKRFNDCEIVGILDSFRKEGEMYGKPIISLQEAIEKKIDAIIVVARPGSCKAISGKIGEICLKHNIELSDIRDNNLLCNDNKIYNYEKIRDSIDESFKCNSVDNASGLKINMFNNRIKNNIFSEESNITISNAYDIGYLFFAPLITDFVIWFSNIIEIEQIENVLFFARDGYLIRRLYNILNDEKGIYFLTSRVAAIRAGVKNEQDLKYVDSMKFSGTIEENLSVRFGIDIDRINNNKISNEEGLMFYLDDILKNSDRLRINYRKYIENIKLKKGKLAVFDFVAKGTTQYFMSNIINGCKLKGFYFLQLEPEYMKKNDLEIESYYNVSENMENTIYDDYYILETILTSPEPSVVEFTTDGNPVYAKETRTEQDLKCLKEIQQGIIDYFEEYILKCPVEERKMNKKLDELFLGFVHNVEIKNEAFLNFVVEDTFFNRMTDIKDVL